MDTSECVGTDQCRNQILTHHTRLYTILKSEEIITRLCCAAGLQRAAECHGGDGAGAAFTHGLSPQPTLILFRDLNEAGRPTKSADLVPSLGAAELDWDYDEATLPPCSPPRLAQVLTF